MSSGLSEIKCYSKDDCFPSGGGGTGSSEQCGTGIMDKGRSGNMIGAVYDMNFRTCQSPDGKSKVFGD